jgi:hypothetical protein
MSFETNLLDTTFNLTVCNTFKGSKNRLHECHTTSKTLINAADRLEAFKNENNS